MARFYKQQTKYSWVPAAIFAVTESKSIEVGVRSGYSQDPDHPCPDCKRPSVAEVELTPHEALAFAAWLQTEADKIIRREQRAEQRKRDRAQKKEPK